MNSRIQSVCAMGAAIFLAGSISALAQTSHPENSGLTDCAALHDNKARLACYDDIAKRELAMPAIIQKNSEQNSQGNRQLREEIDRLRNNAGNAQASVPSAQVVSRGKAPVRTSDDNHNEFTGRIIDLKSGPSGWIVTLDQGQVWRQMNSQHYDLRTGQTVRIYPTRWGKDYRLSAEDNSGFIQVERIK